MKNRKKNKKKAKGKIQININYIFTNTEKEKSSKRIYKLLLKHLELLQARPEKPVIINNHNIVNPNQRIEFNR